MTHDEPSVRRTLAAALTVSFLAFPPPQSAQTVTATGLDADLDGA
jgi:hypothetical protein